jgi:hypothetical protein
MGQCPLICRSAKLDQFINSNRPKGVSLADLKDGEIRGSAEVIQCLRERTFRFQSFTPPPLQGDQPPSARAPVLEVLLPDGQQIHGALWTQWEFDSLCSDHASYRPRIKVDSRYLNVLQDRLEEDICDWLDWPNKQVQFPEVVQQVTGLYAQTISNHSNGQLFYPEHVVPCVYVMFSSEFEVFIRQHMPYCNRAGQMNSVTAPA